ncbi:YrrS family protein [Pontibacillus sp. HMF3514]|uniref:YrrS family protein n=1 Tax=Pontibacillus sp. HMF3514 TaxID=2692425 RepID=UPI0013204BC3|nr:YrrS family protein [Pontibacillus sp. HMF3514]QHE53073.1 DUF1510 family protein [Pontibacillus sp. HMF3514]
MYDRNSRYDRYEKRRKNTKLMTVLGIAGGLLAIILLAIIILPFGDNNAQQPADGEQPPVSENGDDSAADQGEQDSTSNDDRASENSDEESSESNNETDKEASDKSDDAESDETTTQESDDENVIEIIQKDWDPVGTKQEGNHVATYDMDSQDWAEMEKAVRLGADLQEGNSIIWHIGNGGSPQKAIGTITNKAQTETYRVYIQWVEDKGWKPTKVEVLKENDKKKLYQDNDENEQQDDEE